MPEGLSACSFAAALGREEAGAGAPLAAFRGQMAAIYLFDVALSAGKFPVKPAHSAVMSCLSFTRKGCCATCLLLSSCSYKVHYRASQSHCCRPLLQSRQGAQQAATSRCCV